MPSDLEEERARYRARILQWKEMGFDTRDIERRLEIDFEGVRHQGFRALREQLDQAGLRPPTPAVAPPAAPAPADPLDDIRKEMSRRVAAGEVEGPPRDRIALVPAAGASGTDINVLIADRVAAAVRAHLDDHLPRHIEEAVQRHLAARSGDERNVADAPVRVREGAPVAPFDEPQISFIPAAPRRRVSPPPEPHPEPHVRDIGAEVDAAFSAAPPAPAVQRPGSRMPSRDEPPPQEPEPTAPEKPTVVPDRSPVDLSPSLVTRVRLPTAPRLTRTEPAAPAPVARIETRDLRLDRGELVEEDRATASDLPRREVGIDAEAARTDEGLQEAAVILVGPEEEPLPVRPKKIARTGTGRASAVSTQRRDTKPGAWTGGGRDGGGADEAVEVEEEPVDTAGEHRREDDDRGDRRPVRPVRRESRGSDRRPGATPVPGRMPDRGRSGSLDPEETPSRPARPRRRTGGRRNQLFLVILVLATVLALSFGLPAFLRGGTPEVRYAPKSPVAGESVEFTVDEQDLQAFPGARVSWTFPDGTFENGTSARHAFAKPGPGVVTTKISDRNGASVRITTRVNVNQLVVRVPLELPGDWGRYDVDGTIILDDPNGLMTVPTPVGAAVISYVVLDFKGTRTSSVLGQAVRTDGHGMSHSVLRRVTLHDLKDVSGFALVDFPNGTVNLTLSGEMDSEWTAFIDVDSLARDPYAGRVIREEGDTNVTIDPINLGITTINGSTSRATVRAFPRLAALGDQLDRHEFLRAPLEPGKGTPILVPPQASPDRQFTGRSEIAGNVGGAAAARLRITVPAPVLQDRRIETLVLESWWADGKPLPVRESNEVLVRQGTRTVHAWYNAAMKNPTTDMTRGTGTMPPADNTPTESGLVGPQQPWTRVTVGPDITGTQILVVPSNSTDLHFAPERAVQQAVLSDTGLVAFATAERTTFTAMGNYTESGGIPTWNLTISADGGTEAYTVVVPLAGTTDGELTEIQRVPPAGRPSKTPTLLTIMGAEDRILREPDANAALGDGTGMDYRRTRLRLEADTVVPSLDLGGIALAGGGSTYGYIAEEVEEGADGRTLRAGVDAITGQLLFVSTSNGELQFG